MAMSPWVLMFAVVLVAIVVAVLGKLGSGHRGGFPYVPAKTLFSAAERSFLGVLDQAVGADYRVFGKVRIADVATVRASGASARQAALNRIAGKHFDFVICRASDLAVVCAIELNDRSHAGAKAQVRDAFVAEVCRTIGLPLLVLPARQGYSVQELREAFTAAISSSAAKAERL